METIRTGVIGLGMGMAHATGFAACSDTEVTALCDMDERILQQATEKFPDALLFTDYQKMLEEADIDAAAVALPNHLHAPVTIDILRAGIHVLCEKPMALNSAEAENMRAQASDGGLVLMLHFNMRFMSVAATLKPLIESGVLGEIYHLTTTYTRRDGYPYPGSWFGQKEKSGGGPLIDLGVHRLDLAMWLMNYPEPELVSGCTYDLMAKHKLDADKFNCEDFSVALIRFKNGASMYLASSWDGHQELNSEITMNIYGTKASAFERKGELLLCSGNGSEPSVKKLEMKEAGESPQQHFINSIRNGTQPGPSAEHGVKIMKLLDAIYKSAETGTQVKLPV